MEAKQETERSSWAWLWLALGVSILWAVVGFGTFALVPRFQDKFGVDPTKTGTFGDTFGAVNSLFSALGVAGVAYALVLQSREHRDARVEAEGRKRREVNLAMLSALVHARSSLLETSRTMADIAEDQLRKLPGGERHQGYVLAEKKWQDAEMIKDRQIKEVSALITYAEQAWGWDREKVAHL
jgi:hypothetical protein